MEAKHGDNLLGMHDDFSNLAIIAEQHGFQDAWLSELKHQSVRPKARGGGGAASVPSLVVEGGCKWMMTGPPWQEGRMHIEYASSGRGRGIKHYGHTHTHTHT